MDIFKSQFEEVRVLMLGSSGVGKTSLIMSLITEEFPEEVPAKIDDITIPSEVTPERVPTQIIDFSLQVQSLDDAKEEIKKADVVCVVYSLTDMATLEDIENLWMPMIHLINTQQKYMKPVILVGNKVEMVEPSFELTEFCYDLMKNYPEIETMLESSAVEFTNMSEIFFFSQKSILHPIAPLLNVTDKTLTAECEEALMRIFRICDIDNDGFLSDVELYEFQRQCFKNPLHRQGLSEIKIAVQNEIENGIYEQGMTLMGFFYLIKLFIMKGRQETSWTILRKFGYDNKLQLRDEFLCPEISISSDNFIQLSPQAIRFLTNLFKRFDKDHDGYLKESEFENLFSIIEEPSISIEDSDVIDADFEGWPSYKGFISFFALNATTNTQWLFKQLATLGFERSEPQAQITAIDVFPKFDLLQQKFPSRRNTYICKVYGSSKCGKTTFVRKLLKKDVSQSSLDVIDVGEIVTQLKIGDEEFYLIVQEVDWNATGYSLNHDFYDAAIFLFDSTDKKSFNRMVKSIPLAKPNSSKILISTKKDLQLTRGVFDVPSSVISDLGIIYYESISNKNRNEKLLDKIAYLATHKSSKFPDSLKNIILISSAVTVVSLSLFFAHKLFSG